MSAAPSHATPTGTAPARKPEDVRVLGLIRHLIEGGRLLLASLKARNAALPPISVIGRFGSLRLALIIARITRGLLLAEALEARLLRRRPRPEPSVPVDRPRRDPAPRRPCRTDAEDDAELEAGLPTAEEIAARIRHRPVGAVLVEICRDLGIDTTHPLWRDIQKAIIFNGGNLATMLRQWLRRTPESDAVARAIVPMMEGASLLPPPVHIHPP